VAKAETFSQSTLKQQIKWAYRRNYLLNMANTELIAKARRQQSRI